MLACWSSEVLTSVSRSADLLGIKSPFESSGSWRAASVWKSDAAFVKRLPDCVTWACVVRSSQRDDVSQDEQCGSLWVAERGKRVPSHNDQHSHVLYNFLCKELHACVGSDITTVCTNKQKWRTQLILYSLSLSLSLFDPFVPVTSVLSTYGTACGFYTQITFSAFCTSAEWYLKYSWTRTPFNTRELFIY